MGMNVNTTFIWYDLETKSYMQCVGFAGCVGLLVVRYEIKTSPQLMFFWWNFLIVAHLSICCYCLHINNCILVQLYILIGFLWNWILVIAFYLFSIFFYFCYSNLMWISSLSLHLQKPQVLQIVLTSYCQAWIRIV